MRITTRGGRPLSRLGFAAYLEQDPRCIDEAFAGGINLFYFYDRTHEKFIRRLAPIARKHGDEIAVASGASNRDKKGMRRELEQIRRMLGTDRLDIFFAEYVSPDDDAEEIFGDGGTLDALAAFREEGVIRYAGASAHDRSLATRLIKDGRIDVLMLRYNMAHRKPEEFVLPLRTKRVSPSSHSRQHVGARSSRVIPGGKGRPPARRIATGTVCPIRR
jgi:aryl-alcohol dehydrogenase-like predicted oxidoreductase